MAVRKEGFDCIMIVHNSILQSIGQITIQLIRDAESMLCHPVGSGAVDSIIKQLKNWGQASEVQNKRFVLMFYTHQLQCKPCFSLLTSSHSGT